jgi:hypothetical protein
MTDYLTSLTTRHLNPTKGIRPRLPMRFEPARGIGIVSVAGLTDKQKTAAGRRFMTPFPDELPVEAIEREQPEFLSGTRRITRPSLRQKREVTTTSSPAAPGRFPMQETPLGSRGTVLPASEEPSAQGEVRREVPPALSKKSPQRKPGVKSASVRPSSEAAVPDNVQKASSGQALPEPAKGKRKKAAIPVAATDEAFELRPAYGHTDVGQVPGERGGTSPRENIPRIPAEQRMAGIPGSARIIMPEGIRRYSREPDIGARKMPMQEPQIQVTIGRIEVRSVSGKEAQARRAVQPVLDLSDYLQGHTSRGAK